MVGIGIVGLGFMGMIHYLAASKVAGAKVVAISSRDPRKLAGDWTGIKGNFGPAGTTMDLSGIGRHASFDALLADPAVTLVDLCVPNDDHRAMAIAAMEAGKDVLVEKPIALSLDDADAMLAAGRATGRILMVAHVLPFFPEFAMAAEAIRSGRYGKVRAAHLTRTIARPAWSKAIADADRSGGPAIDLHIHDTHFIGLVCGPPAGVRSSGVIDGAAVVHLSTQYLYDGPDAPAVSAISGAICAPGRPFRHGFEIDLERATLSHLSPGPVEVLLADGSVERPEVGSGDPVDAFADEIRTAVAAVEAGVEAPSLSAGLARRALALCLAEIEAVRTGDTIIPA